MIQKNDTDKNKSGRPAKGLSEKRKYRITVKMATGEYYALKSKARKAGVSASEMVRQAVDGIQGVVFGKNGYSFNGSKIDRQFSYSKIAAALNRNSPQERQAQSFRQGISPASGGGGELISGSLGLLDLIPSSSTETPEEAGRRNHERTEAELAKFAHGIVDCLNTVNNRIDRIARREQPDFGEIRQLLEQTDEGRSIARKHLRAGKPL